MQAPIHDSSFSAGRIKEKRKSGEDSTRIPSFRHYWQNSIIYKPSGIRISI
jgi:hypothetical protein